MKYSLLPLMVLCISGYSFADVIRGSSASFDAQVLNSDKPSIVKVSAPWCGACSIVNKPFHDLANNSNYQDIQFVELDFDNDKEIARRYNVEAIPTFLFVHNGQVVFKETGAPSANAFNAFIDQKIQQYFPKKQPAPELSEAKAVQTQQEAPVTKPSFWQSVKDSFNSAWRSISNTFKSGYNKARDLFK